MRKSERASARNADRMEATKPKIFTIAYRVESRAEKSRNESFRNTVYLQLYFSARLAFRFSDR